VAFCDKTNQHTHTHTHTILLWGEAGELYDGQLNHVTKEVRYCEVVMMLGWKLGVGDVTKMEEMKW